MTVRRQPKSALQSMPLKSVGLRATPLVLVFIAITLIVFQRINALPIEQLRTTVSDIMAPALEVISHPFVSLADSFEGVRTLRSLKAENIRLHAENERLSKWYESAIKIQAENQSLHDLLNVKSDPEMFYITTRVVSDPGGAFVKSVLLPVGANDGIKKGSAVMSGKGLIGRITEVGNRSSRVLLISDLNSRIPVVIQNTRTKAILAGHNSDLLTLERLPIDSGLTIGSRIVTSGDTGYLSPEIPIGTIVEIRDGKVFVRPLSPPNDVSHVQVINTDIDQSLISGEITQRP